jgi:hypothetical protein
VNLAMFALVAVIRSASFSSLQTVICLPELDEDEDEDEQPATTPLTAQAAISNASAERVFMRASFRSLNDLLSNVAVTPQAVAAALVGRS